MAGGRFGAEALRRVRARLCWCGARFGDVSVRVCCVRRRRRAALWAPVGGVEELIERLRQHAIPANAAIEAGHVAGGAGVAAADAGGAAFHQDLSPPRCGARPAVPVHDVLGVAMWQAAPAVMPFIGGINPIVSESHISHGRNLWKGCGLVRVCHGASGLGLG